MILNGRGAGFHQFSGLSTPVLMWYNYLYKLYTVTGGRTYKNHAKGGTVMSEGLTTIVGIGVFVLAIVFWIQQRRNNE